MHITEAQAVYLEKFLNFRGNIASLAAAMDIPLVDMIDILSAPAVQKRIKAAAKLTKLRRKMIVADIEITALETLEQVAANKYADIVERRRAAAAILRALHKPKRRSSSKPLLPRACGGGGRVSEVGGGPQEAPSVQTNPFDDPPDDPGEPSDQIVPQSSCTQEVCVPDQTAQNAANYCPQEFLDELREARKNSPASNMTSSQVCTSDLVEAETLHPQEETTKLLEETTQALIELDELCAQEASSDASEVEMHSDQIVPTSHPGPGGANDSCHGCSADEVETEPVESEQQKPVPEGRTKRTQLQNGSHPPDHTNHNHTSNQKDTDDTHSRPSEPSQSPPPPSLSPSIPTPDQTLDDYDPKTGLTTPIKNHTSKPQQNNRKKPYPEKDNPWESHPFARAGRNLSSTHDPP